MRAQRLSLRVRRISELDLLAELRQEVVFRARHAEFAQLLLGCPQRALCIGQQLLVETEIDEGLHAEQVTSYKLQATSYKLQVTSYKLQVESYKIPHRTRDGGSFMSDDEP